MPKIKTYHGFKKFKAQKPPTYHNMKGTLIQFYIPDNGEHWVEDYIDTGSFDVMFKDVDLLWKPVYKPKFKI